jgi:endoglucanase
VILALSAFSMKAITLVWNANTDPDLAGYTVYSGTNSHVYNKANYVGNVTSNTPAGLIPGMTYYFAITAKNTSGLESDFSNEIAVDVQPNLGQPVAATTQLVSGKMKLSWPSTLSSTYRVYYKTKLTDATWTQLTSDLLAAGTTTSWTDPTLANAQSRFYRVFKVV